MTDPNQLKAHYDAIEAILFPKTNPAQLTPQLSRARVGWAETFEYINQLERAVRGNDAYMRAYRAGWNDAMDELRRYAKDQRKR